MKTFTEPEINFMPLNAEENVMTASQQNSRRRQCEDYKHYQSDR